MSRAIVNLVRRSAGRFQLQRCFTDNHRAQEYDGDEDAIVAESDYMRPAGQLIGVV